MDKKVSIALFSFSIYGGGAERFSVNLVNALSEKDNYEIYLLTGPSKNGEYEVSAKVRRREIFASLNFLECTVRLRRFLVKNKIGILLAVDIFPNLCAALSNFYLNTQIVILERNAPNHVRISWKSKLMRKLLYRQADYFVFQTGGAKECYSADIQRRSHVIPNPVKVNLPYRKPLNKEIVAIGRLDAQKNYSLLIHAFSNVCRQNKDYYLRIFGQGHEKEKLLELVKQLNLEERVVFEDFQPDVHQMMMYSDVYVLSSSYEGMPNALMEAMAMGFPVIATDCPAGGPRSLIRDRMNGLLVPVGDVLTMEAALLELINDNIFKEQLAEQALKIRKEYSSEKIMSKWIVFIEFILLRT